MVKAVFYCNIMNDNGDIIEYDFDFDDIKCKTREEVDSYIKKSGYTVGESCGCWGEDIGILTDIVVYDCD